MATAKKKGVFRVLRGKYFDGIRLLHAGDLTRPMEYEVKDGKPHLAKCLQLVTDEEAKAAAPSGPTPGQVAMSAGSVPRTQRPRGA